MPEKENLKPSVKEDTTTPENPDSTVKSKKSRPYKKKSERKGTKKPKTYGILIVEDEKSWKNIYRINLFKHIEEQKKIKFYEATNAKEAIKILVQYYDQIQVMILDLVIGENIDDQTGGMLLLETIVDRFGLKDLGIFIITAYATTEIKAQCHLRGVRGFLDKSELDFENLSRLMAQYLALNEREKGTEVGFYAESRLQKDRRYLYLRWKHSDGTFDLEYIANMDEIERISLPNMITDLTTLEGLKQVEADEEEPK